MLKKEKPVVLDLLKYSYIESNVQIVEKSVRPPDFTFPGMDVIDSIKSTQTQDHVDIDNTYQFNGQILKCNTLTFHTGAVFEFTNLDYEWVAIATKKMLFNSKQLHATIKRIDNHDIILHGQDNSNRGSDGVSYDPNGGLFRGWWGGDGGSGPRGGDGRTRRIPNVYIFVGDVNESTHPVRPVLLSFSFQGVNGGNGGRGGQGGNGGNGEKGATAKDGFLCCESHGGNGGKGGNAGIGGQGGNGAPGGDGSNIFIYSSFDESIMILNYAWFFNRGGQGGIGGLPGLPGGIGIGGRGGNGSTFCHGGGGSANGIVPQPDNLGRGNNCNINGNEGQITFFKWDIGQLF